MRASSPLRKILEAKHLAFAIDIPQPEIDPQTAIALLRDLASDEPLRGDHPPVRERRRGVDVLDLLDERLWIQRPEQTGALKVGTDDFRNIGTGGPVAEKIGIAIGSGWTLP
ncbi:MAG: hypothetical protein WDM89_14900 [Rhizomicrobium sp.]